MSQKKQIVFISRVLWAGGAEKVVYDLAHALDRERFEPHIVHLFEQKDIPISFSPEISIHCIESIVREVAALEKSQSVETNRLASPKPYHKLLKAYRVSINAMIRKYGKIEGWLRRFLRPSVVTNSFPFTEAKLSRQSMLNLSTSNWWPFVLGLQQILENFRRDALLVPTMEEATVLVWLSQLLERRPYIASLHSVESYNLPLMYPDAERLAVEAWMFSNACRYAELVTVPSMGCRDDLVRNYNIPHNHIRVVSNPVNTALIRSKSQMPIMPLPSRNRTQFVYVGRLDEDKNPGLLIDAAYLLRERTDDFVVYCIGKGALYGDLSSKIQKKGLQEHVFLLGELPNPYPLMSNARSLVLTSHVESFALVIVEAMLCGAVPVSVDCPFGPGEILDGGKYGILVPPDDSQSLADAMWRIACDDDLYAGLQKLGLERAQRYDISRITLEWESIFTN